MRLALFQMTSSDDPHANLQEIITQMDAAKAQGAELFLTPEVSNCLSLSRKHQEQVLQPQKNDAFTAAVQETAKRLGLWTVLGSVALKSEGADQRFLNRTLVISDTGSLIAHYDKIHMFDVDVSADETYRESDGYQPGDRAVVVETAFAKLGLTICYDLRFAHLHRGLAQAGAEILLVPAAFSYETGAAHWEVLLRARAIETGCFVVAPAQTGVHPATHGKERRTHGHSMVVAPWGDIRLDAGQDKGLYLCDIDLDEVAQARRRVPSLFNDAKFGGPY